MHSKPQLLYSWWALLINQHSAVLRRGQEVNTCTYWVYTQCSLWSLYTRHYHITQYYILRLQYYLHYKQANNTTVVSILINGCNEAETKNGRMQQSCLQYLWIDILDAGCSDRLRLPSSGPEPLWELWWWKWEWEGGKALQPHTEGRLIQKHMKRSHKLFAPYYQPGSLCFQLGEKGPAMRWPSCI